MYVKMKLRKMYSYIYCPFFFLVNFVFFVESSKILGIFQFPGKSIYMGAYDMMKILSENGHEVTMVSPYGSHNKKRDNIRHIVLDGIIEKMKDIEKESSFFANLKNPFHQIFLFSNKYSSYVNLTLSSREMRNILDEKESFDLVILLQFFGEGLTYIPFHLNIPTILYSPIHASFFSHHYVSNPSLPCCIPNIYQYFPLATDKTEHKMNFLDRSLNLFMYIFHNILLNFIILPLHDEIVKENYPSAPYITEYLYKSPIIFVNGDPIIDNPIPKVPGMIDVGGFHIKHPEELPYELKKVIEEATDGVVYFSLGTRLKISALSEEKILILLKVFSSIKQTVLWKLDSNITSEKFNNVIIRDWFPQNDILAHNNVKLFITHGGLRSIQETIYHGVPCLIFPFFADQFGNANRAKNAGFAETIHPQYLSEENLKTVLNKLLENSKYAEEAKRMSLLMKDKLVSPRETLLYWVNYVIRHKGANHLRVKYFDIPWYQYIFLDLIFFVVVLVSLCYLLFSSILSRRKKRKSVNENFFSKKLS